MKNVLTAPSLPVAGRVIAPRRAARPALGHPRENVRIALATLGAHKLRSGLTVLGIVIGVWTVMVIASIISGVDLTVKREIEALGTHSIFVSKLPLGVSLGDPTQEERMRKPLSLEDAAAIAELPAVEASVPLLDLTNADDQAEKLAVSAGGKTSVSVQLQGTLPGHERTGVWTIAEGRFFTQQENDTNRRVCLLGRSVVESFFPSRSAVGGEVKIGGLDFRVVGVFEGREQLLGGDGSNDQNNVIYIPFGVARRLRPEADNLFIHAVARPGLIDEAQDQIADLLRIRRRVAFSQADNFSLSTAGGLIGQFRDMTFGVTVVMIALSSIGLLVGGIGVMNIMLVSVTERTREIGVRRALGARRRDILWQFLGEAMTLTGAGGLAGLLCGWATTLLVGQFTPSYVPLWAPLAGFAASVGTGLVFGLWPAWKAARLDPIAALRVE